MPQRRVILIDRDDAFAAKLREALAPRGVDLDVATDLGSLPALDPPPELIFIAVDLPDKQGFQTLTRIRRANRVVPIVVATDTLSARELSLHAKLRLHADLYLHKRRISKDSLEQALATLLDRGRGHAAPPEILADASPAESPGILAGMSRLDLSELPDDLRVALFPIDEEAEPPTSLEAALTQIVRLEQANAHLRAELENALLEARTSPFSPEFARLREELDRRESQTVHLNLELAHRDSKLCSARDEIAQHARALDAALRNRDRLEARVAELRETLAVEREGFESVLFELQSQLASEREERSLALSDQETLFEGRLLSERADWREKLEAAAEEARAQQEAAVAAEAESWTQRLEDAARRQRSAQRALSKEKDRELAELRAVHETELSTLRDRHAKECEARASEHAGELETLRLEHSKALVKLERDYDRHLSSQLRESEARHEAAAREAVARLEAKCAELERAHEEDAIQQAEAASAEMERLRHEHERALADLRARLEQKAAASRKAADQMRCQLESEVENAKRKGDEAIASLRDDHADEIAALTRSHEDSLESSRSRHQQELSAERKRFESDLKQQRQQAESAQAAVLEAQRTAFEQERAQLEDRHAADLATRERDGALVAEELDQARSALAGCESVLEDLRRENESQRETISSLQIVLNDLFETSQAMESRRESGAVVSGGASADVPREAERE